MSATLVGTVRGWFACCNVTAQVGPLLTNARNVSAVARTGAGDYTVTLQDGLTILGDGGGIAFCQPLSALFVAASVEQVDATHLRIRTFDAVGVALESNFSLAIQDVGPV